MELETKSADWGWHQLTHFLLSLRTTCIWRFWPKKCWLRNEQQYNNPPAARLAGRCCRICPSLTPKTITITIGRVQIKKSKPKPAKTARPLVWPFSSAGSPKIIIVEKFEWWEFCIQSYQSFLCASWRKLVQFWKSRGTNRRTTYLTQGKWKWIYQGKNIDNNHRK